MIRSPPGVAGALGVVAPPCVTANVRPAIVSVPLREIVLVFAATLNPAGPLPLPLGLVTVIQGALLVAVQPQPVVVVTVVDPVPPAAATVRLVGEIVKVHVWAGWVTVKVRPAIDSIVLRCVVPVLGATLKLTEPEPVPLASMIVTHDAPLVAVHGQVVPVVSVVDPVPPAAATVRLVGARAKEQDEP
jgi:hypothetical protein